MSPAKRPRHALSSIIRRYRTMTGLSQNELSALTFELAEQEIVTSGIMQQHLSRLENGVAPMPGTLHTLAVVLAHAMRSAGFEEADADELHKHLLNANRLHVGSREVSPQAVEIDAILAPFGTGTMSQVIWAGLRGFAEAAVEEARRIKRRVDHNDSQH
jgi:transcriptional regulator with XRE-family HTH domain